MHEAMTTERGRVVAESVAGKLGLVIKMDSASRGTHVTFLSRVFVDPWTTPDSFCDPLRALLKIHVTTNSGLEIDRAGHAKATAYLITDGQTPLVSHWCKAYLRNLKAKFDDINYQAPDMPFWVSDDSSRANCWPQTGVNDQFALVGKLLGVDGTAVSSICSALDQWDGSSPPPVLTIDELPVKITAYVDGELRKASGGSSSLAADNSNNNGDDNNTVGHAGSADRHSQQLGRNHAGSGRVVQATPGGGSPSQTGHGDTSHSDPRDDRTPGGNGFGASRQYPRYDAPTRSNRARGYNRRTGTGLRVDPEPSGGESMRGRGRGGRSRGFRGGASIPSDVRSSGAETSTRGPEDGRAGGGDRSRAEDGAVS